MATRSDLLPTSRDGRSAAIQRNGAVIHDLLPHAQWRPLHPATHMVTAVCRRKRTPRAATRTIAICWQSSFPTIPISRGDPYSENRHPPSPFVRPVFACSTARIERAVIWKFNRPQGNGTAFKSFHFKVSDDRNPMNQKYSTEDYRRFAAQCLETLKVTFDPARRAELLARARRWLWMARSNERSLPRHPRQVAPGTRRYDRTS